MICKKHICFALLIQILLESNVQIYFKCPEIAHGCNYTRVKVGKQYTGMYACKHGKANPVEICKVKQCNILNDI